MPDFLLEPDDIEPERPVRGTPARLVSTGLADTADVPRAHLSRPAPPPRYAPCEACGTLVLTGVTTAGVRLAVDPHLTTYVVDWDHGASLPRLVASRGYPVHRCH